MSKARLVITAVVAEGRAQGEVARAYGVWQGWVSRLVARYRAEGEAAFEPRRGGRSVTVPSGGRPTAGGCRANPRSALAARGAPACTAASHGPARSARL